MVLTLCYHSKDETLSHKNHNLIYSELKDDEGNPAFINYSCRRK